MFGLRVRVVWDAFAMRGVAEVVHKFISAESAVDALQRGSRPGRNRGG